MHITHVGELAYLVVELDDDPIIAGPVAEIMPQIVFAHHPIIIGHRIADRLSPKRVPVQALRNIRNALFVLDVEGRDPLPILVRAPVGGRGIGSEAIARSMEANDVGHSERPLGLKAQAVSYFDTLEPPLLSALNLFGCVDVLDRLHFLIGVGRRFDCRVLALFGRSFALGQDPQQIVSRNHFAPLVDLDPPRDIDDRPAGKFRLFDLTRNLAFVGVDRVPGPDRPIEGEVRPGDEDMNAFEQTLAQRPDFVRGRIAEHRLADLTHHHTRRDDATPARLPGVSRIDKQRIVVAAAIGPVTDRVFRSRLDIVGPPHRLPVSDELALPFDVAVQNLIGRGLLPFLALLDIGFLGRHDTTPRGTNKTNP